MDSSSSALNKYSRQFALGLADAGADVVVLAVDDGADRRDWMDGPVRVRPICRRGSVLLPVGIMRALSEETPDVVHVQHELFAYGGLASTLLLLAAMTALAISGKTVVTTIHGVIPLDRVDREFIRLNGLSAPVWLVRGVWFALLWATARLSTLVVVHGEQQRSLLAKQYGIAKRVKVIPHGIFGKSTAEPAVTSFTIDGAPVVLFFGFLSSYKGIDYLADEVPRIRARAPESVVVVAGEVPKRLRGCCGPLADAVDRLRGEPNVKFLGFVPEERVSEIFAACDVVVLPYRVVMAASGPMSHALGHRKPVLLSNEFADFRDTPLSFNLAPGALAAAIESVVNDDQRRFAILEYQEMLLREWAWDRVGSQCVAIYEAEFESRRAHLPFSRGAYSPIRLS